MRPTEWNKGPIERHSTVDELGPEMPYLESALTSHLYADDCRCGSCALKRVFARRILIAAAAYNCNVFDAAQVDASLHLIQLAVRSSRGDNGLLLARANRTLFKRRA